MNNKLKISIGNTKILYSTSCIILTRERYGIWKKINLHPTFLPLKNNHFILLGRRELTLYGQAV